MKGPGYKLNLDVRRRWRCPETGKTVKTSGSVCQLASPFTKNRVMMKLVEETAAAREVASLEQTIEAMKLEPLDEPSLVKPRQVRTAEPDERSTEAETQKKRVAIRVDHDS